MMEKAEWYARRNDRTLRYAGRVLDPERWVLLQCRDEYASRYDGQVAILTAANLLARMTPSLALDLPDVPIDAGLPWRGQRLRDFIFDQLYGIDPFGRFTSRPRLDSDYVIQLGREREDHIVHGAGWNAFVGPGPSPLPPVSEANPVGPALAAIVAVSQLFVNDFAPPTHAVLLNALTWIGTYEEATLCHALPKNPDLGHLWCVGAGSVGTATLFFLTLATNRFSATVTDMDKVEDQNLDRSPVFLYRHVGHDKAEVVAQYLRDAGVANVAADASPLDESSLWSNRQPGTPDLIVSAANERHVRAIIENAFPPIQIYGTTGQNWQASVLRHIPLRDPCSCCVFPEMEHPATTCATGEMVKPSGEKKLDAALPFLSFSAGLMAASEILKLTLKDFHPGPNCVTFYTKGNFRFVSAEIAKRAGCLCRSRSMAVHLQMIQGSRYSHLSDAHADRTSDKAEAE